MRLINYIHFKNPSAESTVVAEAAMSMLVPILILGLGAIFLGMLADIPLELIEKAVSSFGI
jgi:NADH:ubiquinone oxidoreductase subunit 5 (subunit L)/multisubunit Na+/H+ antiporter MnhA subunit